MILFASQKYQRVFSYLFFCFLLIAAVIFIYRPALNGPFLFDDSPNIAANQHLQINSLSWESLKTVWLAKHPLKERRLSYMSFALNYYWKGMNPRYFRMVNIMIHTGCGLLAAFLFHQILRIPWLASRYGNARFLIIWASAFLWTLHPIQINAVSYIVQRMTSLSVFFSLLSLNLWMYVRRYLENKNYIRFSVYLFLCVSAWACGLLCKEQVIVLPGLVLISEFLLFQEEVPKLKWQWFLLPILIIACISPFVSATEQIRFLFPKYEYRDFTLSQRLMTESRVLWHYLSLFYFPASQRFTLIYDYPVSRTLLSPPSTIISILAWMFLVLFIWMQRSRYRVFSWMTAWFLVSHLVESTILPLEIIYEHRMYMPSLALALGTLLLIWDGGKRISISKHIQNIVFVLFILLIAASTYIRNMDFKDSVSFYRTELEKYPNSKRILLNLAVALLQSGEYRESEHILGRLAETHPYDLHVLQTWYNFLLYEKKDTEKAEEVYQQMLKSIREGFFNPIEHMGALEMLVTDFLDTGRYAQACAMLDLLVSDFSQNSLLWYMHGHCLIRQGSWERGGKSLQEAWKLSPDNEEIKYWYGESLIHAGNIKEGCRIFMELKDSRNRTIAGMSENREKDICKEIYP
ncbi:MAG: hypothetical protein AB7S75_21460 [Desulfococcaceae bacterium]